MVPVRRGASMSLFGILRALAVVSLALLLSEAGALAQRAPTSGAAATPQPAPRPPQREAIAPGARRSVPIEDLRLYADAFHETRAAGHILLDKIAAIIATVPLTTATEQPEGTDCSVDRHGAPRCFDPRLAVVEARSWDPPSIAARRAALELIAAYNGMLIDLANGRDPRELQSRLGEVAELAGTILGLAGAPAGLPALVPVVATGLNRLVERVGAARTAAVTRQEILDNRDTIKALLAQLKEDVPKLYEIYRVKRLDDRREALSQNNAELAEAASSDLRQFHASLAAYFVLIGKTSDALDMLALAAADTAPDSPHGGSGFVRGALDLRRDAKAFWDSIRRVGDRRR
jgi:hypothetical protein